MDWSYHTFANADGIMEDGAADSGQLVANDLPILAPIVRTSPMLMLIPPCPCQLDVRITCVVSTRSSTIDASRVYPYIPRLQRPANGSMSAMTPGPSITGSSD